MSAKNKKILPIVLLLLLILPRPAEPFIFTAIMSAVSFAYQAYNIINDAHDTYKKFAPQTTLDDVLDQAKKVEAKVDQIGSQLSKQINQAVDTIVTRTDDLNNIREGMGRLSTGIRRIDNLYRMFELYTSKKILLNNHTLQDYIQQVTTVSAFAPKDILDDIHEIIIPSAGLRESLLYYVSKNTPENDEHSCGKAPPQGQLYQLFRLIMINEIRAFTIMAFAYTMNQVFKCESFAGEIAYAEYQLQTRAKDYYDVFSEISDRKVNSIRTCSPPGGWKKGETYIEFERFETEYITSERGLRPLSSSCEGRCPGEMEEWTTDNCEEEYGCTQNTVCNGGLLKCAAVYAPITLCTLGPTGRRYQYFINASNKVRGNNTGGCQGKEIVLNEMKGCEVCWCTCTEDSYKSRTLRTFSTREQLSDVANNKVVTGVKFVVMENMTHLQIQQGEVLPEGRIVTDSVEWKPLENIKFDEERTYKEHQYVYYIDSDNGTQYDMKIITDYISFTWDRYRIHIDDVIVPPGYVVTGVKFAPLGNDEKRQPVQLGIQASPYDYESGKIEITDDNPSIWLTSEDMVGKFPEYDGRRSKFLITFHKNPLSYTEEAIPMKKRNSFIAIAQSSSIQDAGQTVIPFLDSQEVVGKPPFAAGGMGFYYKRIGEDIGGFVGIRLFALDALKNLHVDTLDKLDDFKKDVAKFKGCNNAIAD